MTRNARAALALSAIAATLVASGARAADPAQCAPIPEDLVRLKCYDEAIGRAGARPVDGPDAPAPGFVGPVAEERPPQLDPAAITPLSRHWESDRANKTGTFSLRSHKPTYFLPARASDRVNAQPSSPQAGRSVEQPLAMQDREIKFQISFKVKFAEDLPLASDIWFGYTQKSHWQLYNRDNSAPFRETNYEPEVMWVIPTDYRLLGLRGRFVNLGAVHESNGRTNPLSRSWNRIYAQAGLERGGFALLVRPWWRLPESDARDDNPDIQDYVGRGEVQGIFKGSQHVLSLTWRGNVKRHGGRGSIMADWAFPLAPPLRGHVQLFSGYGESLIDYNHRQNTIGIGVSLAEWM